jgi:hypothetical protein
MLEDEERRCEHERVASVLILRALTARVIFLKARQTQRIDSSSITSNPTNRKTSERR